MLLLSLAALFCPALAWPSADQSACCARYDGARPPVGLVAVSGGPVRPDSFRYVRTANSPDECCAFCAVSSVYTGVEECLAASGKGGDGDGEGDGNVGRRRKRAFNVPRGACDVCTKDDDCQYSEQGGEKPVCLRGVCTEALKCVAAFFDGATRQCLLQGARGNDKIFEGSIPIASGSSLKRRKRGAKSSLDKKDVFEGNALLQKARDDDCGYRACCRYSGYLLHKGQMPEVAMKVHHLRECCAACLSREGCTAAVFRPRADTRLTALGGLGAAGVFLCNAAMCPGWCQLFDLNDPVAHLTIDPTANRLEKATTFTSSPQCTEPKDGYNVAEPPPGGDGDALFPNPADSLQGCAVEVLAAAEPVEASLGAYHPPGGLVRVGDKVLLKCSSGSSSAAECVAEKEGGSVDFRWDTQSLQPCSPALTTPAVTTPEVTTL